MTDLQVRNIDRDLIVLDQIVGDSSIPTRDWNNIITLYERNNSHFPIPSGICTKIIQRVKDGEIPKMVFKEYGANFNNFKNRYNKDKVALEELALVPILSEVQWNQVFSLRNDPFFLLMEDIEKASAFHFNKSLKVLEGISTSAQTYIEYMKLTHPEEFTEKSDSNKERIEIKLAIGLLESV